MQHTTMYKNVKLQIQKTKGTNSTGQ